MLSDYMPMRTVTLLIGAKQTGLKVDDAAGGLAPFTLAIGSEGIAAAYFHHEPPTPEEIEAAINVIEDELMKAAAAIGTGGILRSEDQALKRIAGLVGGEAKKGATISRVELEELFTRFAALSMGRPTTSDVLPVDASFAATLLLAREIMHHLDFTSLKLS